MPNPSWLNRYQINSREQPVMASGPSSLVLILLTESARELLSHVLLFVKPAGGFPNPLTASNWAARKRDRPSPSLPSVFDPYQFRPWARMNCSTISATRRYRTKLATPVDGLMVTVRLPPLRLQDAPPPFCVTLTGMVKFTSRAMLPNHPDIRLKSPSHAAITALVRTGSGPPGLIGAERESSY